MHDNTYAAAIEFSEQMSGYISHGQQNFITGEEAGKRQGLRATLRLDVRIEDVDRFVADPAHVAAVTGSLESDLWGGEARIDHGEFNLFRPSKGDQNRRMMNYRFFFRNPSNEVFTLSGSKDVHDDVGFDSWSDTTTLFVYVFQGKIEQKDQPNTHIWAAGILRLGRGDFLRQMTTFRAYGGSTAVRFEALRKFGHFFLGNLWEIYGPRSFLPHLNEYEREIPLYTTEGVKDAEFTIHPFNTADKLGLSLSRFRRAPSSDVVMIIHGLTTSTDMFIMPEHYNLVSYLLDHGFTDVWSLDYRMSNRFPYNLSRHRYTMDDIALFDYPAALATIRAAVPPNVRVHVICHCLGSVSFMMSLFGKAVTGISSVVANSVALTPCVPSWSRLKLRIAPFFAEYILQLSYFNPRSSQETGFTVSKAFTRMTSLFHRECDVPACHMLSVMWGTGWPALYNHANLAEITHRRGGDLYGPTSFHYYRHVSKMVESNNTAVKYDSQNPKLRSLPDDYFTYAEEIETPVLLITGAENRVFAHSNIECHRRLEKLVPGRHSLRVIPNYGHQDVFMGERVADDVFPSILEHLNKYRG